jgi:Nitrile hydratase beta subunit
MNSIADMGGMDGFGPVQPEANEPVFHADWERRCFSMFLTSAAAIGYSVDEFRHGMESLPPLHYLSSSYYEHWLAGYEKVFTDRGIFSKEELEARVASLKEEQKQNA